MPPVKLSERVPDPNIRLIFAGIFVLGLAYGVSLALVGLFLDARGFEKREIGTLAVWFAGGIVALSLPMGWFIRRFSARAALTISLFGYAVAVAAFPLMPGYASIAAVRVVDGACSVGIWVSCETILLSRANKDEKAFVTSLYAMAMAMGYILGPFLAKGIVAAADMKTAFFTSGLLAAGAGLLILLRLDADVPESHDDAATGPSSLPIPGGSIVWRIKTACFATFAYGYFQASTVLFLPLYLVEQKGIVAEQTILVPAFFAAGMLLFTNVAGRYGDRNGHLSLMRKLAVVGFFMILGFVFLDAYWMMCVAVFIAGASLASISPLSLALQGVVTRPSELSRANAIYNVFYASGMLLGPLISSAIFDARGGIPMLYHLAAMWAVFILFTVVFRNDDPRTATA